MSKLLFYLVICLSLLLGGCISATTPDDASYIRVSKGEYGGALARWVGLAADGSYYQITSSEENYEWTSEDLDFLKEYFPADSEEGRIVRTIEAVANILDSERSEQPAGPSPPG